MTQHAKIQSAIASVRQELRFTNDEKTKLNKQIASLYIDAEPSTRAGRRAFAELNQAKDDLREVLKLETVLQTLLGLAKKASKAAAAELATKAAQERMIEAENEARELRRQAALERQAEVRRQAAIEREAAFLARVRRDAALVRADREMKANNAREKRLQEFEEEVLRNLFSYISPSKAIVIPYTAGKAVTQSNRIIFKFQ